MSKSNYENLKCCNTKCLKIINLITVISEFLKKKKVSYKIQKYLYTYVHYHKSKHCEEAYRNYYSKWDQQFKI